MLRLKLADMAREAKKIKAAPLKAAAASSKDRQRMPHFRILESPACRRVVLRGPSGRLDGRAAESLMMMLRAWENNYLVKAVMLQGRPRTGVFSVGWERGKDGEKAPAEREHALQRFSQLSYVLATLSKPTVAWLNGEVRGSGLGLALARCRLATKSSSFRVGAAKRGWALDGGASFALPRLRAGEDPAVAGGPAALAMARYLALTGAPLSGADMLACGMATHLMDDATAAMLPKRLADLTYEPDHVVEDALSEHATLFYKTDSRMNSSPYRDLWADWAANDETRERMIRMAARNGGGQVGGGWADLEEDGEEEDAAAQEAEEEDPFRTWAEEAEGEGLGLSMQQQNEESRQAWEHEMVAEGPMAVRLKSKQLLFRQGLLEEDEDGGMGGGRGGMRGQQGQQGLSKAAQREARAETEGSLWWHRNFAPGDEALVRAQIEAAESEIAEDVLSEGMQAALSAAGKFTDGRFPEYFTYPERRLLVEGDRLLLSPWDCSVDRSGLFPEFVELSAKVQRCFEGGSLEEVVEALKADGSAWAQECLKHMDEASPLSLRLAFQQLEASTAAEIEECFRAEYRVGVRLLKQRQQQQQNGGALGRLAEVPVVQAEEMVCRPLEGEEGQELFLPERVAGEVRGKSASAVERRFARTATTKGSI